MYRTLSLNGEWPIDDNGAVAPLSEAFDEGSKLVTQSIRVYVEVVDEVFVGHGYGMDGDPGLWEDGIHPILVVLKGDPIHTGRAMITNFLTWSGRMGSFVSNPGRLTVALHTFTDEGGLPVGCLSVATWEHGALHEGVAQWSFS